MKEPLVSIIVPVYNLEDYIEECIESIIRQDYSNLEIIVVNDGSSDQSGIILDSLRETDNRIRIVTQGNGGLVSARKTGLEKATGQYVMYVDGDDWIDMEYVSKMISIIYSSGADCATSGIAIEEKYQIKQYDNIPTGEYDRRSLEKYVFPNILYCGDGDFQFGIQPYLCNKIFRRKKLTPYQMNVPNDISVGEDVLCVFPYLLGAEKIVVTGICDYHYRRRTDSMTKAKESIPSLIRRHQTIYEAFVPYYGKQKNLQMQVDTYYAWNVQGPYYDLIDERMGRLFSYQICSDEKIIIYGFGKRGRRLIDKIKGFVNIVAITDRLAYDIEESYCGIPIVQLTVIKDLEFDKILISVASRQTQREIAYYLGKIGVAPEKIVVRETDESFGKMRKRWEACLKRVEA